MSLLLRFTTLRHLSRAKLRSALTVAGLALGVALYVAIRLCNESVSASFRDTVTGVSGAATLEVIGGERGFDERALETVVTTPGVLAAAPVIIRQMAFDDHTALVVLGVDPFSEAPFRSHGPESTFAPDRVERWLLDPKAVLITARFASSRGLESGDELIVLDRDRAVTLVVAGTMTDERLARAWGGAVALMDIAAAQWTFDRVGRLDRIDVLTAGDQIDAVRQRLVRTLPPDLTVQRPEARLAHAEQVVRSFQVNLTALSGIALLVGLFLIYNTMTHALLRRRAEVGLLRALGVGRSRLFGVLTAEALAFGVAGGAVGVPLGWLLARTAVGTVSSTVEALYGGAPAQQVVLTPHLALEGLGLGCLVAVAAALVPIVEALRTVPREVLHPGWVERRGQVRSGRLAIIGGGLGVLAVALSQVGPVSGIPWFGYGAALCLVLGGAFLTPLAGTGLDRLVRPFAIRTGVVEARLASGTLAAAPGRTAVAAGALMTALAMMISVVVMVGSFRDTVKRWIEATITADLYVSPASRPAVGSSAYFDDPGIVGRIASVPGVVVVDPYRQVPIEYRGRSILLSARDLTIVRERSGMQFMRGDANELLTRLSRGEGIAVSEVLAKQLQIGPGEVLDLPTAEGRELFPVLAVFYDYATDGGRVVMDRSVWQRHWRDQGITALAVYLDPDADPEQVRAGIEAAVAPAHRVSILSNRALKTEILDVFDQTFAITRALDLVAMTVAALGIASTVLAIVWERRREIGIVRALGASQAQVRRVVVWEAALIGLLGGALGVGIGLGVSLVLIKVVNVQSFGWTIIFSWRTPELIAAALLGLASAMLAGWLPARYAANLMYLEALADE
ncbi:MAG: FtsX-like permease family protein [Nitrospirota bacterium]